jgi:RTX calcium-binding nonapeptide repeat (4 copies)
MSNRNFGHHHKKYLPGTQGDDWLVGSDHNDVIFGFRGDDDIFAGRGNDKVFAGRGNDRVDGGAGHDELNGEQGNDGLAGGEGNDHLNGGSGRDFLVGGAGRDKLEGGQGADKFVIRQGTGVDTVEDLHSNDRIDLRDFNFNSGDAVIAAFRQRGHDAVLDLGNGDKLILEDTRVSQLDAAQFIVSDAATGPSSSASPYVVGVHAAISTQSLLTVGDQTADGTGWQMVGIPDGLGAYDNGDGTFTVLMNHELGATQGVVRDHGSLGSFVSTLTIDKTTLEVTAGKDLIQTVHQYNAATDSFFTATTAFNRFCSADLAESSAFYNAATGLGYNGGRLFLNGEESGTEGRAFAHIANGSEAGNSYELAFMGNMAFENLLANPGTGNTTVVAATDDGQNGQVYFYFGQKQATGNAVEKAGLVGGSLYGLQVSELNNLANNNNESNATNLGGDFQSAFSLINLGNVSDLTGSALDAASEAARVTSFLRPEDGAWSTLDSDVFYFVTTNGFNAPSRLWAAEFSDASNPASGGTIRMLLDGTEGQQMLDNMTVTQDGKILLQEDVGGNAHIGKVWQYDPTTDGLTLLAQHDPDRFDPTAPIGGEPFLTIDEESSGIIDVTDILGSAGQNVFLWDVQAHYNIPGELVQGGQLGLMYQDLI